MYNGGVEWVVPIGDPEEASALLVGDLADASHLQYLCPAAQRTLGRAVLDQLLSAAAV